MKLSVEHPKPVLDKLPPQEIARVVPELLNQYREVLGSKPDFVEEDLYRSKIIYYYKYIKERRKYIMVVVKITNNHGYVLTAYLTEK